MKVAVLGAGAGGKALAAYLTAKGCKVNLYNRTRERIEDIIKRGGIEVSADEKSGVDEGFMRLNKISTNIEDILEEDVESIFIVTTANAHKDLIHTCIPYLREGQIVFFAPGYGGALQCAKIFRRERVEGIKIAESLSLFFVCRTAGPSKVRISAIMGPNLRAAAFPSKDTSEVIDKLKNYISLIPAKNVLETTLMNPNPIIHPLPMLSNFAQAELNPNQVKSYVITPSVLKAMNYLDEERRKLCAVAGVSTLSLDEIYNEIGIGPVYRADLSPTKEVGSELYHFEDRFISEDVPYGLVAWFSLGQMMKVHMPGTFAVIQLASMIKQVNYFQIGLTVEDLGIENLDVKELDRYLTTGRVA